MSIIPESFNS